MARLARQVGHKRLTYRKPDPLDPMTALKALLAVEPKDEPSESDEQQPERADAQRDES